LSSRRLSEKQIAAIEILSRPNRGGMTYEQIAKEVGVARSTLFEWKKQDYFNEAVKKEIIRKTQDRLPEVFDSIIDNIIETGNATAFKTLLQAHGMLTDKVEVNQNNADSTKIDDIKAEIERLKQRKKSDPM
jgi:AcrR family transcriptional regulator